MNKDDNCIFCKIIAKEIPAKIISETSEIIILQDIKPSAPFHHLVIPKTHIRSVADLTSADSEIIAKIFLAAKDDATKGGLIGYKTVFNVGREGGQIIDHLHLHILGDWTNQKEIEAKHQIV